MSMSVGRYGGWHGRWNFQWGGRGLYRLAVAGMPSPTTSQYFAHSQQQRITLTTLLRTNFHPYLHYLRSIIWNCLPLSLDVIQISQWPSY